MHPDVCGFISEEIYDGRLVPHPDCSRQGTEHGTGLRWVRATHQGCSSDSEEEAAIVAGTITGLLGSEWTDAKGVTRPLEATDFVVVAPFNDQVRMIRRRLAEDPATAGVPVGTVDKFQGQEAPIVLISMVTSNAEDLPRNIEFLYSKNRLNVAVSRAQCLAVVVANPKLLEIPCGTVEQMKLVNTFCWLDEYAGRANHA